jgi:hypothetical protein
VVCPPTNGFPDLAADGFAWAIQFLSLGGGSYCDIWGIHPYPGFYRKDPAPAEQVLLQVQRYSSILRTYGLGAMPIWNTEASWGEDSFLANPAAQAAFVSKHTMLLHAAGVQRSYWFAYDTGNLCPQCWGPLWGGIGTSLNPAGAAYGLMERWFIGSTPISPVARQQGVNRVRNAEVVAPSPTSLPTHWHRTNNDAGHGIAQTVTVGTGYIDWRVYGTAVTGAAGFEQIAFEDARKISCSGAGQQWWMSIQTSLRGGSYANVTTNMQLNEYNARGEYLTNHSSFFIATSLDHALQAMSWFASTTDASCAFVQPLVGVNYHVGKPFDITIRFAAPHFDDGTQFVGTYLQTDGSFAILAWDSGFGSNLAVGAPYASYQDVSGVYHAITNGFVALTSSPVLITAKSGR